MKGRLTWPKFAVFEGRYEHGRRKFGRLGFADGSYYKGEFLSPDGTCGGIGKLVTLMISYEGEFRNGAFHGQGCLKKTRASSSTRVSGRMEKHSERML